MKLFSSGEKSYVPGRKKKLTITILRSTIFGLIAVSSAIIFNACNEETAVLPGIVRSGLSVTTYPEGARIILNNVEKTVITPVTISDVEPGFYKLEVKLRAYLDTTHYVLLKRGLQDKLYFEMREDPVYWWYSYRSGSSGLPNGSINRVRIDSDDRKWFATDNNGLISFRDSIWSSYNTSNSGIQSNNVQDIFPATDGTIWLASSAGIIRFRNAQFLLFNKANSRLPDNYITSIAEGKNSIMWFGTREGGLIRYDGINFLVYNTDNSGIISNRVTALACDSSGAVYIGSYGKGISVFDGNNWKVINGLSNGLVSDYITKILPANDGNIWIGTGYVSSPGGLTRLRGSQLINYYVRSSGTPATIITDIARDLKGNLWISTADQGLFLYTNGKFVQYNRINSGMISNEALSVAVDRSGNKWIGTIGVVVYTGRK